MERMVLLQAIAKRSVGSNVKSPKISKNAYKLYVYEYAEGNAHGWDNETVSRVVGTCT